MKLLQGLAGAALVAGAGIGPASAQIAPKDFYAGAGVTLFSGYGGFGVGGRVGANLQDAWGIEGDLAIGFGDEDFGISGYTQGFDYSAGVFGTYTYPLGPELNLLGRLGIAGWSYTVDGPGIYNGSFNSFGLGAGVGLDYKMGPGSLRADFTSFDGLGTLEAMYMFKF